MAPGPGGDLITCLPCAEGACRGRPLAPSARPLAPSLATLPSCCSPNPRPKPNPNPNAGSTYTSSLHYSPSCRRRRGGQESTPRCEPGLGLGLGVRVRPPFKLLGSTDLQISWSCVCVCLSRVAARHYYLLPPYRHRISRSVHVIAKCVNAITARVGRTIQGKAYAY